MSFYDREESYLKLLEEGDHTVRELALRLFISEPTVRRDVARMKEKDLVVCHSGTVKRKAHASDRHVPLFIRDAERNEAKTEIAVRASRILEDGFTVMLDGSTTAYHLLPHLAARKNILLITNGAKAALEATALGIKVICTGGEILPESFAYVGPDAESTLRRYHADVAFFSCRGLSEDGIATDSSIFENSIRRIMLRQAKRSFLLCDQSKRGQVYLNQLCQKDEVNGILMNGAPVVTE